MNIDAAVKKLTMQDIIDYLVEQDKRISSLEDDINNCNAMISDLQRRCNDIEWNSRF